MGVKEGDILYVGGGTVPEVVYRIGHDCFHGEARIARLCEGRRRWEVGDGFAPQLASAWS
eukprot:NODE_6923_length_473_cov_242.622010.p2 GENE.NODE_6923_length_473_cov_242.622010~~NODE_6923_length_473_cov_242.622010.p2  ORF type:complete len:60 (+),score=9.00 NODE_6923_length_473_cov_242.622010:3-182(+)